MQEDLKRIFREVPMGHPTHAYWTEPVPNDPDTGALVINDDGDVVLYVQKPKNVVIPWFEVTFPMDRPKDVRERDLDQAVIDRVEVLLTASRNVRADGRADGTGSAPMVPERMVLEELGAQLRPHRLKWLCAGGRLALEVARRLQARADGLEIIGRWGAPDGTIVGLADPVGYRLPWRTQQVFGSEKGSEDTHMGWLTYPGRVAVVEVAF